MIRRSPATRALHPGAWWLWALALATAATRTSNPLLLALLVAVAAFVVMARGSDAPWGRSFGFFLRLGLVVLVVRLLFAVVFGSGVPGHVLVHLPEVPMPSWLAGLHVGGDVTAQALAAAFYLGLQLAALLACVGAANALASPQRLLRALPGALYEAGVAVTVALSFAPQAVIAVSRVRDARRLRGRSASGMRGWAGTLLPVLEDALERSVDLAAAMDARGFGRRGQVSARRRHAVGGLTLAGLLAVVVGVYGLLDTTAPAALGLPVLGVGALIAAVALVLGGRGAARTRYRPDVWGLPEWGVTLAGAVAVAGVIVAGHLEPGSLAPSTQPLAVPALPWPAVAGALLALTPAWLAPRAPRVRALRHRTPAVEATS